MFNRIASYHDYEREYRFSIDHPNDFWREQAKPFHWFKPFESVLKGSFESGDVRWFDGGQTNITYNCLDRQLPEKAHHTALIFEPNKPGDSHRKLTYQELYELTCKTAHVLKSVGIAKGDRVCIYMPMIPEAVAAMLACARIGAVHTVVFAGFSVTALAERINDCDCKMVLTADGFYRGEKYIDLVSIVHEAMRLCSRVQQVAVWNHSGTSIPEGYLDYRALVQEAAADCPAEPMDSEAPLFILYTSGSTGKPKGLLHTTAGYMVYAAYTFFQVFQYRPGEVHWCTADIGWVTGHSYIVYGPLLNGATTLIYEGVPTYPAPDRNWDIIDKYQVNIFYTAPTAIRSLQAFGTAPFEGKKLDSLRVLGSVGEPINEEAWEWYHQHVGKARCPIADTWWQTETGGVLIAPLAGIVPAIPAWATQPLPGILPQLTDGEGNLLNEAEAEGNLCISKPWPGMARSIYGDHERYMQTYFGMFRGKYFTGDGVRRDASGNYRITGRVDDVMNVSGHRIGTGEVEDAINMHPNVVESAVVAYPHDLKGQAIYAFVICEGEASVNLVDEIRKKVSEVIGAFAKPDKIQVVRGLPKTRSGKIMRRILRKIGENDRTNFGDTSTLLDPSVVEEIWLGRVV